MDTDTVIKEPPPLEAEYESLRAGLMEAHQPRDAHERVLVEEFIEACWDQKAARRVDREFWYYVGGHYNHGQAGVAEAQFQEKEIRFRTHLRHRANCERSYYRALAALKDLSRDTRRSSSATRHSTAVTPPPEFSAAAHADAPLSSSSGRQTPPPARPASSPSAPDSFAAPASDRSPSSVSAPALPQRQEPRELVRVIHRVQRQPLLPRTDDA